MMKKLRLTLIIAALTLGATVLLTSNAMANDGSGFNPAHTYYAAGSSAQFNTFGLTAGVTGATGPGNAPVCGTHHWTRKFSTSSSTGMELVDPRSGSILPEGGSAWVVWDDLFVSQSAGAHLCFYISIDSVVGNRVYFANATVNMISPIGDATDNTVIPGMGSGEVLPALVWHTLQNQKLNVAHTDIRPEDAKFATIRALYPAGAKIKDSKYTGVGYGNGSNPPNSCLGNPIYSSYSTVQANVVDFAIDPTDSDPCGTAAPPRPYATQNIGAAPVMIIANVSQSGSGHFGDGNYTDIGSNTLAMVLNGTYTRIRQISHTASVNVLGATTYNSEASVPITLFQREPLSGTYNTTEYCITLNLQQYDSLNGLVTIGQETGVNPANQANCVIGPCVLPNGNPLYLVGGVDGNIRRRAIGTGEMVGAVNATADSMGYAFWGYSSYNSKPNLHYMTVDGVDPLFITPSANPDAIYTPPQCTGASGAPPCPAITFPNIANGSYPIWSVYRIVYDNTDGTLIWLPMVYNANLVVAYPTGGFPDFVPLGSMSVFRSHFTQSVITSTSFSQSPNNGYKPGNTEKGGDMGGAVLTIQSEVDFNTDTGGLQQVNLFQ